MKKTILALALAAGLASAEAATFGTGANQFTLDFTRDLPCNLNRSVIRILHH